MIRATLSFYHFFKELVYSGRQMNRSEATLCTVRTQTTELHAVAATQVGVAAG